MGLRGTGWRVSLAGVLLAATAAVSSHGRAEETGWVEVDYARLVDRRELSHSGETVDTLLRHLDGRPIPPPGERPSDALWHRLLDPILEPYAFVLPDAIDTLSTPPDPPMVEVGWLFTPGGREPAWVELVRSRHLLLESDGEGKLRAFVPTSAERDEDSVEAARRAWDEAWPVLRHALAAERRRLARDGAEAPVLEVDVHPYRHHPARSMFRLGRRPHVVRVEDTGSRSGRPPLDLDGLAAFLAAGDQIEGARLDPDGTLRWFASKTDNPPQMLGRPLGLADFAVAYRAVAHGGYGEPYMSLDRSHSPQVAVVNYGGRLRDTALGMVSLLCDVRFKTFSIGVGVLGEGDLREALAREVPGFRTHLERFASDPRSVDVPSQQTRLWFYPDDVDLTVSAEGDVLAMRRVRMTAASERVELGAAVPEIAEEDPPWTVETIAGINDGYEDIARVFPELASLDQSVRLLAMFTWLEQARERDLPVPDLDVLLAVELPAFPTPRRLAHALTTNVLPPPESGDPLERFDRSPVGEALERLRPRSGRPLPAARRFARAAAALDRRDATHAALATDLDALDPERDDETTLDLASARVERQVMHDIVGATLDRAKREEIEGRRARGEALRVFNVGIGGIDLATRDAVARAAGRSRSISLGGSGARRTAKSAPPPSRPRDVGATFADPPLLPGTRLPDHGLGGVKRSERKGEGTVYREWLRAWGGHFVRRSEWKEGKNEPVRWVDTALGADGPDVRFRRLIGAPDDAPPTFERVEGLRFLRYRLEASGSVLRAQVVEEGLSPAAVLASREDPPPVPADPEPDPPAILEILPPVPGSPTLPIRLSGPDDRNVIADVPRGLLRRLVLGRSADLTGGPLPLFTPAAGVLGGATTLMVLTDAGRSRPPWDGPRVPVPGEENAITLGEALLGWWRETGEVEGVVIGTDRDRSPVRLGRAPAPRGRPLLLLPEEAFPTGRLDRFRASLAGAWPGDSIATDLPAEGVPPVVIVVSGEAPGVLSARIRALTAEDALRGKLLAVVSLGGRLRGDLPASLVASPIAGLGVAEVSPIGREKVIEALAAFGRAAESAPAGSGIERIPGPFLWYF